MGHFYGGVNSLFCATFLIEDAQLSIYVEPSCYGNSTI